MALELVAAIVAAVAMAGIALSLQKLARGRLPKWIVPVFAGAGLLGFAIYSEYDWYGRQLRELPEGVVVAWTASDPTPMRPWTFLFPYTSRFGAVDRRAIVAHPTAPSLVMARVYAFGRWQPVRDGMMVFDCAANRQVAVREGMEIDAEGRLTGADWIEAGPEDGYQRAVCGKG